MDVEIIDLEAYGEADSVSQASELFREVARMSLPHSFTMSTPIEATSFQSSTTSGCPSVSVSEGRSSNELPTLSHKPGACLFPRTNSSMTMSRKFSRGLIQSIRTESMIEEDWAFNGPEQMRLGNLRRQERYGGDTRSTSSSTYPQSSIEETSHWPFDKEVSKSNSSHISQDPTRSRMEHSSDITSLLSPNHGSPSNSVTQLLQSTRGSPGFTMDDTSEVPSSPSRDDESPKSPFTPLSSQSSQSSQESQEPQCFIRYPQKFSRRCSQGFSRKRPIDLTDFEINGKEPESLVHDDSVVDLTAQLDRAGKIFKINPADCMTDDEFRAWLPCSFEKRATHNVQELVVDSIVYQPSMSLKLHDNSYLRIETIRCRDGEYFLRGRHLFAMTDSRMEGYLPKVKGELVWMENAARPISLDEVASHQNIQFTNERTDWHDHDDLVCRLKVEIRLRDQPPTRRRDPLNADESIVEYLSFKESDPGEGRASWDLRDCWRGPGETFPFGAGEVPSMQTRLTCPSIIDPEDTSPPGFDLTGLDDRAYTFGDAYCGAGGASCGARQAGLINTWASDINHHAVDTYQRNFDNTVIHHAEFFHLMTVPESELRVDIAHCSPPCQPFSPAHTIHNQKNDEQNSACVFTGSDLIKRVRPRVLTMEETNGLRERFKPEFNRIILNFIQDGYSVRWSVLECSYYGVPQYRKRLLIIAAGPGETLPDFPQPTHSLPGGGLKPIETIHRAIDDIPLNASGHDVESLLNRWAHIGWRQPYNGHQPARTLTCNGGESNYHPSGKRSFTPREVACLQTFPVNFQFSKSNVRKQIGNAVPPKFAEAVFREVCRSLRETDAKELQEREALRVGM